MSTPMVGAPLVRTELTWRGLVLGVLITVLFTAANVYFGLRAGLTFATSIPAADSVGSIRSSTQAKWPVARSADVMPLLRLPHPGP